MQAVHLRTELFTIHSSPDKILIELPGGNMAVAVRVYVTEMLVRHLNTRPELTVDAKNLGDLLNEIERKYQGFRDSICDESGRIRTYINVFVNGQNVRQDPESLSTPLADGDEVYILASVAGGES